ncbi:glycerophosphodiester phosphodiesterase family protein [Kineococcus terrestris]|uniref:glycerophosphodiester phosphodiesterase family protein n=1 Tax=Kineococcus terrestris TaxID=2044856 RepID=UPI0034DB417E
MTGDGGLPVTGGGALRRGRGPVPAHPWFAAGGPLAVAHRGFAHGPTAGLENSLPAFAAALALGYRYLETDARLSADGRLVAFHDERLDRVTDGAGVLAETPWALLRQVRIGGREPVPLLEDLLAAFPAARFNVDLKDARGARELARAVARTGSAHRVLVTAFSDARRRAALRELARAGCPPVATSAGTSRTGLALAGAAGGSARLVRRALAGVGAVQVPVRHRGVTVVDERFVAAVHAAGAQVHVWTVDDPQQAHALLDLGVDGLITDRADVLREVLRARGQWTGA